MGSRRERVLLAALIALALALAYALRFGCDDAWISYIYARALERGDGLTWFGEPIEGYTNFAWVLWIAAGLRIGADPLHWAWLGSLASLVGTLILVFRIVRLRTESAPSALAAVAILGSNFTFLAFATSGLETMFQTFLLVAIAYGVERERRGARSLGRLAWSSLAAALALWTRLDSAVPCLVLGIVLAHHLVTQRAPWQAWACSVGPVVVLVGGWLAWKLSYYGDLVPNTAHAKLGGAELAHGALCVGRFLHAYLLWPALALVVAVSLARRRFAPRLPAALAVAWLGYVSFVGGDFMEFRFFVPVLPMLVMLLVEVLLAPVTHPRIPSAALRAVVLVVALATASWRHAVNFQGVAADGSYDSVGSLGSFYGLVAEDDWSRLGTPLRDALAGTDATIACQGAGAIPYFADLPTIDQLGLSDRQIARTGEVPPAIYHRPGHRRFASLAYLRERRVTFVIGSPELIEGDLADVSPASLSRWINGGFARPQPDMPASITIVAAPIGGGYALLLWYLHPTLAITARIEAAGWQRRVLGRAK